MTRQLENTEENKIPESGFTVPEGYFDNLRNRIRFQTTEKEPLTNYNWPDELYFNDLKSRILSKTVQQQPTFMMKLSAMPVFRYAAAAVLVFGMYLTLQPSHLGQSNATTAQLTPSNDEIIKYLNEQGVGDLSISEFSPVSQELTLPAGESGETLIIESL